MFLWQQRGGGHCGSYDTHLCWCRLDSEMKAAQALYPSPPRKKLDSGFAPFVNSIAPDHLSAGLE